MNQWVFKEIKEHVVRHPESLPNSTLAKATSFGYNNVKADFYRLQAIQYIGGNVLSAEYKKYLYKMLDLITDLNPYFEWPYFIGELLLPSYNYRYEKTITRVQQDEHTKQWEQIGLKGIANLCDREKLGKIKQEFDLTKLWSLPVYKNPCKSHKVPYFLAYLYYFSFHKPETSAFFYKVTSAVEDSYKWAKIMAAIMQGKSGDREKSVFMFLNLSRSLDDQDQACLKLSQEIEKYMFDISKWTTPLDGKFIKSLRDVSSKLFGEFDEKEEEDFLSDTKCSSFVNKAVREINLLYLENANNKYFKDTGKNAIKPQELLDKWYIDTLPRDFQQYKDYGVEYEFNLDTLTYDYDIAYPQ